MQKSCGGVEGRGLVGGGWVGGYEPRIEVIVKMHTKKLGEGGRG